MKRFFVLICVLSLIKYVYGQSYSGRIIDEKGEPVYGAIIINMTNPSADITERDGRFSICAEQGDSLLIREPMGNEKKFVCIEKCPEIIIKNIFISTRLPQITNETIDIITRLYYEEKYRDCIAYCNYFIDEGDSNFHFKIHSKSNPVLNWDKMYMNMYTLSTPKNIAKLCYIGALSAHKYIGTWNVRILLDGRGWAMSCMAISSDLLRNRPPAQNWSANTMYDYIVMGEEGMNASIIYREINDALGKEFKFENTSKWINRKADEIYKVLDKVVSDNTFVFENHPYLQYKMGQISMDYVVKKEIYRSFIQAYKNHYVNTKKMIFKNDNINHPDNFFAILGLNRIITKTIINEKYKKKIGKDFVSFCMEEFIKLQDLRIFLHDTSAHSLDTNYTLQDIKKCLKEDDCIILFFDARASDELLDVFHKWMGLGSPPVIRDYALVLTSNMFFPEFIEFSYLNKSIDEKFKDYIKNVRSKYSGINRFFVVGPPITSFYDIAGNDSSIVRLHSLSQLLHRDGFESVPKDVTFVGDINYELVGDKSYSYENNSDDFEQLKGKEEREKYEPLPGTRDELKQIKLLFNNAVHPICGDEATKDTVLRKICTTEGVVHISTHGYLNLGSDSDYSLEDIILKNNIMDNCFMILSGYNDNPQSTMSYVSGSDILKLNKINTSIVFLDACLSGQGDVGAAGSIGIADAFHLIGAKNIICYLEPVEDDIATEFSNRFYLELSKGKSCHSAFFAAKNSMDNDLKVVLWE